jgi:hypothetical protein
LRELRTRAEAVADSLRVAPSLLDGDRPVDTQQDTPTLGKSPRIPTSIWNEMRTCWIAVKLILGGKVAPRLSQIEIGALCLFHFETDFPSWL